jgi:hypothetical protein
MLLIKSINNSTHEVVLRHDDLTEETFVVPETERYPSSKKLAYIQSIADAHMQNNAKMAKRAIAIRYFLDAAIVIEAVIIALLLRH